jgi:DNA-binding HxlR family transcriptional regulator
MEELDEEVYSTIFSALRHGVRRNILRMLEEREHSFTDIEEKLGLSSSHLTYHLDSLKELITKTEKGYRLSVFGKAAVDMMKQVETPPRRYNGAHDTRRQLLIVILVVVLCSSLFGLAYYIRLSNFLQTRMASASYHTLVDDMGLSFSLLRSSYTSILDTGKLDYYNVKQLLYQSHQLRSQRNLLKTMDSRHHREWFELDFMAMEHWHFFRNLEERLLQDPNLDPLVLTEEQSSLMREMRESLDTIICVTETDTR